MAKRLSLAIHKEGLATPVSFDDEDAKDLRMIGIHSKNREEWVITDIACMYDSVVTVPLYDTLGPNIIDFISGQAQFQTMFCALDKVEYLVEHKDEVKTIKSIVCFDEVPEELKAKVKSSGLKLYNFYDLIDSVTESEAETYESKLPEPESLYTICYTSGTTGDSKGVKISHENIVAMVSGVNYEGVFSERDVCYSYLPLSHMAERAFLGNSYAKGTKIGFFSGSLTRIREDLKLLRPTIFSTVPRILQKHAAAIKQEMNS